MKQNVKIYAQYTKSINQYTESINIACLTGIKSYVGAFTGRAYGCKISIRLATGNCVWTRQNADIYALLGKSDFARTGKYEQSRLYQKSSKIAGFWLRASLASRFWGKTRRANALIYKYKTVAEQCISLKTRRKTEFKHNHLWLKNMTGKRNEIRSA